MTETIGAWQARATKILDVRPILANGGEPFVLILETAAPLHAGDSLLLTAPFEPVPLYAALAERGFTHQTEAVSAEEWWVLFTRSYRYSPYSVRHRQGDASARGLVPTATSAHTLRHTFARNYLAEHPGDLVGLAALLGHTSLETTRIYSQPTIEQLATRVEQLRQNAYGE